MSLIYVDAMFITSKQNFFTQQVLMEDTIQMRYNNLKFL